MAFFGNKLLGSLGWMIFGAVLFLASFWIIFTGEGRTELQGVAETAVEYSAANTSSDFTYVTDTFTGVELGDGTYVVPGKYAALNRKVEMFAWKEEKQENKDSSSKPYYRYSREWTTEPQDSAKFGQRDIYQNPQKGVKDLALKSTAMKVGSFELSRDMVRLPGAKDLALTPENTNLTTREARVGTEFIYIGNTSIDNPQIGDLRVSYTYVPFGAKTTVFGKVSDGQLLKHHGKDEGQLYRVFTGDVDDAIAQLTDEYNAAGWGWRVFGFFVMWIGLLLVVRPLSVATELVPLLPNLSKPVIGLVTFIVAFVLTWIAGTLSAVLHNTVGLIAVIVIIAVIVFWFTQQKKTVKKK